MAEENMINSKIFIEISGEIRELKVGEVTLDDCVEIVQEVKNAQINPEFFRGGEISFRMSKKETKRMKKVLLSILPIYFTNNYRKMHNLPLKRRKGKKTKNNLI